MNWEFFPVPEAQVGTIYIARVAYQPNIGRMLAYKSSP